MADAKGLEEVPEGSMIVPSHPTHCAPLLTCFDSVGQIESNYDETCDSFDGMNLRSELLRGMGRCCYLSVIRRLKQ